MRGGDKETFFHCLDRVPSGIYIDADLPSTDEEEEEKLSFESAGCDLNAQSFRRCQAAVMEEEQAEVWAEMEDPSMYDVWMSDEPISIQERRCRLHQGLGMVSSRDLALRRHSTMKRFVDVPRSFSRRIPPLAPAAAAAAAPSTAPPADLAPSGRAAAREMLLRPPPAKPIARRRSESFLAVARPGAPGSGTSRAPAPETPPSLRRARSLPSPHDPCCSSLADKFKATRDVPAVTLRAAPPVGKGGGADEASKQDNGKEDAAAAVVAAPKDQSQTGVQLGLEEFEKFIGNNAIVKHLMRRGQNQHHSQPLPPATAPPPKGDKSAGKKKGGWLKNIKSVAIGFIQDKDVNVKSTSAATAAAPSSGTAGAGANASTVGAGASAAAPSSSSSSLASSDKLKVHNYGKSSKELTGLYMSQEILAHEGSIWSIKFSADGRRLASAGEDSVVRVWEVVETTTPPGSVPQDGSLPPLTSGSAAASDWSSAPSQSKKATAKQAAKSGRDALPDHLVVPDKVFALAEPPLCVLEGHDDDVLDLTWSKSDQLLSSSMDKTVRLWDTATKACLKRFSHSDYVTCIQFNPVDDRYFISGSLDAKIRLWSIPDRQVVDWTDLNEMVTATSYTPDGQGAIIGSHKGSCRLYKTSGCKLSEEAQIDIDSKKRKSQAKKITGLQFAPGSTSEVLVTSADSQIRVFDGDTMLQKFRGFKNTSSQISAEYTSDGRYVVCASEDSHVYLWRTTRSLPSPAAMGIGGKKAKTWCTTRSYENFFCKDVSAAVPWPNSPSSPLPGGGGGGEQPPAGVSCSDEVCTMASHAGAGAGACSNRPPLPADVAKSGELSSSPFAPPLTHSGQLVPTAGVSPSARKGAAAADTGNAWGLVVVTATLSGEIRVYQNFGMPFRIKGQGNLFH